MLSFERNADGARLRTLIPAVLLAALLAWSPSARAECAQPYTGEQLVSDLQTANLALRNLDDAVFGEVGKRLEGGIVCLSSAAPSPIFASTYRYIGAYHFLVLNDEPGARSWFRTAIEIDSTHRWDAAELDLTHPMRAVYEGERDAAVVGFAVLDGKSLAAPAGSKLFIDGRPLAEAGATTGRPHVVQQVGATDKALRGSWLISGNAIPEQFLRDASTVGAVAVEEPETQVVRKKKKTDPTMVPSVQGDGLSVMKVERVRPPEKTPLIIVGGLGVAGAGVVYGLSALARQDFEAAQTTEELEAFQQQTNTLVLASGGILLAGLGIGYWGVILDGGGGLGVTGHF